MQGLGSIIASPSLFVTPHKDLTQQLQSRFSPYWDTFLRSKNNTLEPTDVKSLDLDKLTSSFRWNGFTVNEDLFLSTVLIRSWNTSW